MMTADEYRAHAEALEASSESCGNYLLMLQLDASARDWRKLAELADLQDTMLAALAATRADPSA